MIRRFRAMRAAREAQMEMDGKTDADWRREAEDLLEPGQVQVWKGDGVSPMGDMGGCTRLSSAEEKKWEKEAAQLRAEHAKRIVSGAGKRGLLAVDEAAAYSGVTTRAVMAAMRSGKLTSVKVGLGGTGSDRWRFKRHVLDGWIAERRKG